MRNQLNFLNIFFNDLTPVCPEVAGSVVVTSGVVGLVVPVVVVVTSGSVGSVGSVVSGQQRKK